MFASRVYEEDDRRKWSSVLQSDLMSSEDSGEEDELYVKPLNWRSKRIENFFMDLDSEYEGKKSSQAKRQTKTRILAETPSKRPAPSELPSWAFSQEQN